MSVSKQESLFIDALRFIAILSVAAAHTTAGESIASNVMRIFATGGVAIFFLISGYLAQNRSAPPRSVVQFIVSKVSLVIPWWITGTIVYLYTTLRHGTINFCGGIEWNIGAKTYLWYMSVLLLMQLLFWFIGKIPILFYLAPILSVVNYIVFPDISGFLAENNLLYINVFNWIWIFWIGALLRKHWNLQAMMDICKQYKFIFFALYLVAIVYLIATKTPMAYWGRLYPVYVLLFVPVSMSLASLCLKCELIQYIGKISFSIYLLHMPIAGILAYVIRKLAAFSVVAECIAVVIAPFACLAIVTACIWVYARIASKTRFKGTLFLLIGLPKRMF